MRILAAACLAVAGVALLVFIARNNDAGQRDFISYWAAGQQLAHGADPYDSAAILREEAAAGFTQAEPLIMRNPPIAFLLALPLGYVTPNHGIILWFILLLASLVVSVRMLWMLNGRPDNRLHLLGYCFAPVMGCLMLGQFGLFLLLGVTLFLSFYRSRPLLAGAALVLCALKPHLFLPFAAVLLVWALTTRAYRILAGAAIGLLAATALAFAVDRHAWAQYAFMMNHAGMKDTALFTLSKYFRLLIDRDAFWLQFVPQTAACLWALWYFVTRRARWDWLDQGLVVLLVGAMCSPYSWFTDEAMLLPAVLAGLYRADRAARSLIPFGVIAVAAIAELLTNIPVASVFYLWTTPAWLLWYLYSTGKLGVFKSHSSAQR